MSRGGWWRTVVCAVLVILAGGLITAGAVGQWAETKVIDTSGFVDTIGPLSAHPEVTYALANTVTDRVVTVLTEQAGSAPIGGGLIVGLIPSLKAPIHQAVESAVTSDSAAKLWTTMLDTAQREAVASVEGTSNAVAFSDGTATIHLNDFASSMMGSLSVPDMLKSWAAGLDLGTIEINTGLSTETLRQAMTLANSWRPLLALGIVLIALAAIVARRTGAGLLAAGVAIVAAAGVALVVGGGTFTPSATSTTNPLSSAISTAIMGSLKPGYTHVLTLALISGVVLIVVGAVLWVVGRARTGRPAAEAPAVPGV